MGKSASAKANITEYRMSIHLGVALRVDEIRKILIDDKEAWAGSVTSNTVLNVNKPNLFGGEQKEGGFVGAVEVMLGADDQVASSHLASRYGRTPATCPGFRGYTSLFFRGSGVVSTGFPGVWDVLSGTAFQPSIGGNGAIWKNNTPLIAQKIEVEATSAPRTGLDPDYALIPNPDRPAQPDANPAHMIWEALVDDEVGMGVPAEDIDDDSFEAAAQTLFEEGFGLTILWMRSTTGEAIIDEILQHIQATLFTSTTTGKLTLKLHRFDYVVDDLPVFSPDNARLTNWRIRADSDVVNEIAVTWTNPDTEQDETITGQVTASVDALGGEVNATSRNYYGVRHAGLARKLLARDLRESTARTASGDLVVDRSAFNLEPGSVIRLNWPRRSGYQRIMRVGKIDRGRPGDSKIRVPLVEDVFSLQIPPIAIDPGTGWEDPSADPSPLTMQLTTLPAFFVRNGQLQSEVVEIESPEVLVMSLADSQDDDSLDYELVGEEVGVTGQTVVQSRGAMTMTPLSYLTATLAAAATSTIPAELFPDLNWGPAIGGFIWLGYGDQNQEIALVTGRTDAGWTVERGVLDTTPRVWIAGTPVWCVTPGSRIVDETVLQAAGATVTYRGLDRTSRGQLAFEDAPDESATLTARPHLPLRPADVQVNGMAFGSLNVSAASTIEISWATRNRLLEDVQPLAWTDGPVQPEYRQETVVRFYDVATGDLVAEYPWLWLDTSISFPKTAFNRWSSVRVEVTSRRDDLWALQAHSVTLTGLAGNPAAPMPPAPAARTEPPAVFAAPAEGAFTAAAGTDEGPGGSRVPTIVVSGQPAVDARTLVTRYRISGSLTWTTLPSVPLNGEAVTFEIPNVQPETSYDVAVAYVQQDVAGQFRTLPDVMTGAIVSGETVPLTPGSITEAPVASVTATVMPDGTTVTHLSGSWTPATNATSHLVEIDDGVAPWTEEWPLSIKNRLVRSDRAHRFRVRGISRTATTASSWSPWSNTVSATQDTTAPGVVGVVGVTALARRCIVQWTAPADADLSHFEVARNTTGSAAALTVDRVERNFRGTIFTDTNVSVGGSYYYWVRPVDRTGNVGAWVFIGAGTPTFIRVDQGDVGPTDPALVTQYGISSGFTGQTRFATAATLSLADSDIAAPWTALESRPALTQGAGLTEDYAMADPAAWAMFGATFAAIDIGPYGSSIRNVPGSSFAHFQGARTVPVDREKTYMVEGWIYSYDSDLGTDTSVTYGGVDLQDVYGNSITGDGSYWLYSPNAVVPPHNELTYYSRVFGKGTSRPIPSSGQRMRVIGYPNYGNDPGVLHFFIGWRIVEVVKIGASLYRLDGTLATEPQVITEQGIAAGIENQGSGATANELAQLNPGEGAHLSGIAQKADRTNLLVPSSGVILRGNSIENTTGGGNFVYAAAARQRGPCFIEMDIAASAWNVIELDKTGPAQYSATAYLEYHSSLGEWNLRVANVLVAGGNAGALTGKIRLEYDGQGFRVLIVGKEYAYRPAPAGRIFFLYPTAYAYSPGILYTGINSGALSPRDTTLTLVPFDVTSILEGNSIAKSVFGATGWTTGGGYSQEVLTGSASLSFRSAHAAGDFASRFMAGLTDNIGSKDYPDLDFAFYMDRHGDHVYIFENGNLLQTGPDFTPDTLVQITYDGDKVRYWVDGALLRTTQTTFGRSFRFMTCQYDVGSTIKDIQWRPSHQVSVLGQNTVRPDTGGLVPQAEIRTPEGVAAGYSGQTAWGTYGDYTPSQIAPRVAAGLNSLGDIQRPIPGLVRQLSDIPAYDELIAFDGSDTIGFDPLTPTSPIDTVGNVLRRGPLHVESEGAVGDGIADDTAAIQAALNTGRDVFLTAGKVYKVTSPLTMSTNYQRFVGPSAELKAVGNFDVLTVTGGIRGAEVCLTWHSPDHTGGWSLRVINADRTKIRAYFVNVWGGLYVQKANVCSVEWLYGSFRGPGIKWWGNAANRSDLLTLKEVYLGLYGSPTNQDYGLDWDGNCHSLEIKLLTIVNAAELGGQRRAMVVRNTAAVADPSGGHPHPIIARVGHIEIDYPYGHGIEFLVPAHDFDLMMPYIHACNGGSGIKLSSSADGKGSLRIHGGKIDSNSRYAIENDGPSPVYLTNTQMFLNTLGDVHGPAQTQTPRLQIDDQLYLHVDAGNPLMGFDANDYILYSRGANFWEFMIGGTRRALIDSLGVQAEKLRVDDDAYLAMSGGNPVLNFDENDALGYDRVGDEFFYNINGVKRFGITAGGGWAPTMGVGVTDLTVTGANAKLAVGAGNLNLDDGYAVCWGGGTGRTQIAGSKSAGTLRMIAAGTDVVTYSAPGGNARMTFDTGDYVDFNRTGNYYEFLIGSIQKLAIDGDGVKAPGFRVDDQLRFYLDGTMALVRLDTNDVLSFNRSTNTLTFEIGSSPVWKADAAQFEFLTPTKHKSYSVAALPTGASGLRALVTDAVSPTFGATVSGGGTITVPVFHDGASWKVG